MKVDTKQQLFELFEQVYQEVLREYGYGYDPEEDGFGYGPKDDDVDKSASYEASSSLKHFSKRIDNLINDIIRLQKDPHKDANSSNLGGLLEDDKAFKNIVSYLRLAKLTAIGSFQQTRGAIIKKQQKEEELARAQQRNAHANLYANNPNVAKHIPDDLRAAARKAAGFDKTPGQTAPMPAQIPRKTQKELPAVPTKKKNWLQKLRGKLMREQMIKVIQEELESILNEENVSDIKQDGTES